MQISFCSQFREDFINFAASEGLLMELEGSRMASELLQASPELLSTRLALQKERGARVCGIIYAHNPLSADRAVAEDALRDFYQLLDLCGTFGADVLSTVTGRDQTLSLDDNVKKLVDVFGPMVQAARGRGVKLAFENCPGHATFATTPENWERIFTALDTPYLAGV